MGAELLKLLLLYVFIRGTLCIPLNQFYPFGPDVREATTKLAKGDDVFSQRVFTEGVIQFFGQLRESVIVSVNGAIVFHDDVPEFTTNSFPLDGNRAILAPFWADVDTSKNGNVWYHLTVDSDLLRRATEEIANAFPDAEGDFIISSLLIVTWDHVGYYGSTTDKTNTFQCILATDGLQSFAIFLYADEEIQWITGKASGGVNGLGGIPAQVGLNKGDGTIYSAIPQSRTQEIINIASISNVDTPGVLIFNISNDVITVDFDEEMSVEYVATNSGENEYYFGYAKNLDNGNPSLVITTHELQAVSYTIEAPGIGYYHSGTITTGNSVAVNISTQLTSSQSDVNVNKGIFLKTTGKVTVVGQNVGNLPTSDTFTVLPAIKSCSRMYIYYGVSVPRTTAFSSPYLSTILVVGSENNTIIKVTVTQACSITIRDTTTDLTPGIHYSFMISRLQTVFIGSLDDLTGSKIVTDKPVSVFSGHECGNVPWNIAYCDHIIEQIPPTTLWGRVYYTAPLATRNSYTIKVLAAHDSTNVDIYCNNTRRSYTINEGKTLNRTLNFQEYCVIYANKKVLVVEFGHGSNDDQSIGDPLMTLVPATAHYTDKFDVSTIHQPRISSYKHYVNIIVMSQYFQLDMIYVLSGGVNKSLDTQEWVPVKVNNVIEAYATKVVIQEVTSAIIHVNTNALMAVIVYGLGIDEGYSHSGRLNLLHNFVAQKPTFTMHPSNHIIHLSTNHYNLSLTCEAEGASSYIWDKQIGNIPSNSIGVNTNMLTIINLQPEYAGNYRCVATNDCGSNVSDYAIIVINVKPCEITHVNGSLATKQNTVTATFSVDDSRASFLCQLDGERFAPCTSPHIWTDLQNGNHQITVMGRCPEIDGTSVQIRRNFDFEI